MCTKLFDKKKLIACILCLGIAPVAWPQSSAPDLGQDNASPQNRNTVLELPPASHPAAFDKGSVQFIGNATVIIRYAGFTILTDPISFTKATMCISATA
ncbi:MAG: hypothetical protein ACO1NO_06905 [Burkholderiaceae bacterium]